METFGLMFYNNILSLPIVAIIVVLTEWEELATFDKWHDVGFQVQVKNFLG